ncbi:MAG TPA: LLM class flavin-dependent oxidoreductase [Acidimicrobiia bacterium]|nr:LLM class flavin-dependent oxidoreductase [Acidimicrobiia bacterium]
MTPRLAAPLAAVLEASGAVDFFQTWDQLTGWWPRALWHPHHSPLAGLAGDPDSFHDAFVLGAIAAGATERMGLALSTDSIRRGPVELLQAMLSLSQAVDGRAIFMIGAGEAKQIRPFGYRRSEGLDRMRELFRVTRLLLDADGPIDYDGPFVTLRQGWIGAANQHPPEIWGVGGGPQLFDLAVGSAAGLATAVPAAFPYPEQYEVHVRTVKQLLEAAGRDPETFGFGVWACALVHKDEAVIRAAFDNPLLRFYGAVGGRLEQTAWEREGVEPVFPPDWHYALKLLPSQLSGAEAQSIVDRATPKMVAKSFLWGTPASVAGQLRDFVEAGANWVTILDFLPAVRPLEESFSALARSIEICRLLKTAG